MKDLLRDLQDLREEEQLALEQIKLIEATIEDQIKPFREALANIRENKSRAEEAVRAEALEAFRFTGKKKLPGGVGIREKTTINYDVKRALGFAKEKDMFLALDSKAFEKAAPNLGLDWVEVSKEPQATLPKEIKLEEE